MNLSTSIKWGNAEVPILHRYWRGAKKQPYRRTYDLVPGQSWFDAETEVKQWETYAETPDEGDIPIGALISRELRLEGSNDAVFTENVLSSFVLVDSSLVCVEERGTIASILNSVRAANNGSLAGFPDVVGTMPGGRIAFREAKSVRKKDRLAQSQHHMADLLRQLFGERADLAVILWDH